MGHQKLRPEFVNWRRGAFIAILVYVVAIFVSILLSFHGLRS